MDGVKKETEAMVYANALLRLALAEIGDSRGLEIQTLAELSEWAQECSSVCSEIYLRAMRRLGLALRKKANEKQPEPDLFASAATEPTNEDTSNRHSDAD